MQRHSRDIYNESASSHKSLRSVAFHVFHALPVVTCTTLFSMQFLLSRKGTSFTRRLLELLPTFHSYMYCKWIYQIYSDYLRDGACASLFNFIVHETIKSELTLVKNSSSKISRTRLPCTTQFHCLWTNHQSFCLHNSNYSVWLLNYTWFGKKATKVLYALAIACTCAEAWNHLVTGETSKRTYWT